MSANVGATKPISLVVAVVVIVSMTITAACGDISHDLSCLSF